MVCLRSFEVGGQAGIIGDSLDVIVLIFQLVQCHGQSVPLLVALYAVFIAKVGDDGHSLGAVVGGGLHVVVELSVGADDAVHLHLVEVYLALVVWVCVSHFRVIVIRPDLLIVALGLAAVGNLQLAAGDVLAHPLQRVSRPFETLIVIVCPVSGEVEHGPLVRLSVQRIVLVLPVGGHYHYVVMINRPRFTGLVAALDGQWIRGIPLEVAAFVLRWQGVKFCLVIVHESVVNPVDTGHPVVVCEAHAPAELVAEQLSARSQLAASFAYALPIEFLHRVGHFLLFIVEVILFAGSRLEALNQFLACFLSAGHQVFHAALFVLLLQISQYGGVVFVVQQDVSHPASQSSSAGHGLLGGIDDVVLLAPATFVRGVVGPERDEVGLAAHVLRRTDTNPQVVVVLLLDDVADFVAGATTGVGRQLVHHLQLRDACQPLHVKVYHGQRVGVGAATVLVTYGTHLAVGEGEARRRRIVNAQRTEQGAGFLVGSFQGAHLDGAYRRAAFVEHQAQISLIGLALPARLFQLLLCL